MADTKISALTSATTLDGTELIAGVQSGGNVSMTPLQLATYIDRTLVTKTTTYAVLAGDIVVICTTSAFTATLPTAVGVSGKAYVIKNGNTVASGNVITVATTGGQTIDLASTATLNPLQSITVVSNNANWWII